MKVLGVILLVLCSMTALAGAAYLDAGCIYDRPGSYVTTVYSGDLSGIGGEIFAGSDNGQVMDFVYTKCVNQWSPKWSFLQVAEKPGRIAAIRMSDLDKDGNNDLIFAADTAESYVVVLSNQNVKWTEEKGGSLALTLDVADVDADGTDDIVYGNEAGSVVLLSAGKTLKWSTTLDAPVYFVKAADLDGSGQMKIVALTNKFTDVANVYVLDADGKKLWTYEIGSGIYQASENTISVGDMNGDGNKEIVVATYKKGVIALDDEGTVLWNFPMDNTVTAVYIPQSGGGVVASSNPYLYIFDRTGTVKLREDIGAGALVIQSGDIEGNDNELLVLATKSKVQVFDFDLSEKGEWSIGNDVSMMSMRIDNVDADPEKEIIVGYGWDAARLDSQVKTGRMVVLEVTSGAAEITTTTRKPGASTTTQATTEETTISKTTTTRYKPPQGTTSTKPDAGGGGFDLGMSGIIIIGVLGAGALFVIVIAIVVLLFLKKKKKTESPPKEETETKAEMISSIKEQVDSPPKEEKKKAAEKK
jgi:hypothetical protein